MKISVEGKVANTTLAAGRPLLPLYEAIVNSIQAIEDAGVKDGLISITIHRESQKLIEGEDPSLRGVTGFEVSDNGIGFNDANFKSFDTSDSTFKAKRGGKGVGRFLWLVAFREVEVESIYQTEEGMRRRTFQFAARGGGIHGHEDSPCDDCEQKTVVRLIGLREKYQAQCRKKTETIADHIAEHCLEFFLRADCPQIELNDAATATERQSINRLFDNDMIQKTSRPFKVKGRDFCMTHVRLYAALTKDHQAHYCANDRVVQSRKLAGRVPNLHPKIRDAEGRPFVYAAYVESNFLNDSVTSERTSFAIDEEGPDLFQEEIAWSDITQAVEDGSKEYLQPFTDPVREEKRLKVEAFVSTQAPMYRPILPYIQDKIDRMDPGADADVMDVELYRAYHAFDVQTREEGTSLLKVEAEAANSLEDFEQRLEAYFEKVSDLNMADLARYVCQRKAVLDFLNVLLRRRSNGKYHLEKHVHNVIFPMGKTSADVLFDSHNLWLIDEKLAYHAFLSSDKTLNSCEITSSESNKEPDVLVFDHACAFVPSSDQPYPAVSLIEFKRPMRDDYTEEENPFVQVRQYIDLIRKNKARTPDGREILIAPATPFYCYIICDLGTKLETWAADFELVKTPDSQGYYGFKRTYNAYFEVISYTKMVSDAQKRNAIFFEKLRLPSKVSLASGSPSTESERMTSKS